MPFSEDLERAEQDAIEHATAAFIGAGSVKAPAQSHVMAALIKCYSGSQLIALLKAWNTAFHKTVLVLADAELLDDHKGGNTQ